MINYLEIYKNEILFTAIVLAVGSIIKYILEKIIKRFGRKASFDENRIRLTIKYLNFLINLILLSALFVYWGASTENFLLTMSSIFAVIGVALFAQWSILSNVTAGFILFFNAPFRIGKKIKLHDKDLPDNAEIIDIQGFYTYVKTEDNNIVIIPNNLLLQKAITIVDDSHHDESDLENKTNTNEV